MSKTKDTIRENIEKDCNLVSSREDDKFLFQENIDYAGGHSSFETIMDLGDFVVRNNGQFYIIEDAESCKLYKIKD